MSFLSRHRLAVLRAVAVLITVVGAPVLVALGTLTDDAPIRLDEPAPRTVIADQRIGVTDELATEQARQEAAQAIGPSARYDAEAQAEIVERTRRVFDQVRTVREPVASGDVAAPPPSADEQVRTLAAQVDVLDEDALRALVGLSDTELAQIERETVGIAQQLARTRMEDAAEVEDVLDAQLPVELAVRAPSFPGDIADAVVAPLIRAVMRPTVIIDDEATAAAREAAAAEISDVVRTWQAGEAIVRDGEIVTDVAMAALTQRGLVGTDPLGALARAVGAMLLIVLVSAVYLRQMQPKVWRSGAKAILLATLTAGYALVVSGVGLLVDLAGAGWWFAVPAGAFAMLTAILVNPVVGIATMLPASVLILLVSPQSTSVAIFAAATALISVPLVTQLSSRSDLRSATFRAAVIFPVLALLTVAVFGPREDLPAAVAAGLASGLATALLVQGLLPFLETAFRLPTVTALLDLADRNHPLLRELEQKALGSYNHSVMVASLVERSCRKIGANTLLGGVAALYHDIGKVRQPHFFIENQQGIANPHDELEPRVSAEIIQSHVQDGVKMARKYHLPPEVVACIGSHHGTMLVTYFYRKALEEAHGDLDEVDVDHFRYKGTKPHSKEAAVLLMADCSEAAVRAAALDRGTLPRADIEQMVDRLIQARVDDGQFEESDLAFAEMSTVRDSIVEALTGIYHPRIAYPGEKAKDLTDEAQQAKPLSPAKAG